jgi:WD40 repeat protein
MNTSEVKILEKGLLEPCSHVCWCPTMDLVALAGFKTLMIHRLDVQTPPKKSTWERICAIETPAVISTLAWHPDGIAVVCGLEDGRISVWEIDSWKEITAKNEKVHAAKIKSIQWTKQEQQCKSSVCAVDVIVFAIRFLLLRRKEGT